MRITQSWSMAGFIRLMSLRGSFAGDTIVNFAGSSLARAITLASMPFVTRIYTPADLGVWAIILTLAGFLSPLATLRYDVAIVIAPTQRIAAALVLVIVACSLALAAAVVATVSIAPHQLLEAISGLGADKQGLLAVVPLILIALAAQATLEAWLTRERKFGTLSLAQLVQAIVTAAAMLGLSMGLAVTACVCGVEILAFVDRRLVYATRSAIRRFKVYPLYLLPYSLSSSFSERVLQLVLANAYSLSVLGAFYVARQLVMAPALLVSVALRQVLFAHSARQSDAEQSKDRVDQILRLLIDAQAPGLAFCLFWLKPILTALMGASWAPLGDFAWWILFPATAQMLAGGLVRMLDVLGRQRLGVTLQLATDLVLVGIALLSPRIGLDEVGLVAALSVGTALSSVIWLGITLGLMNFGLGEMLALGARACGLCVLWSGMQFTLAAFMPGPWGLVAASLLLALSLAPLIFKLASHFHLT